SPGPSSSWPRTRPASSQAPACTWTAAGRPSTAGSTPRSDREAAQNYRMNTHDEAGALAARWLAGRLTRRQALGRLGAAGRSLPAASAFLAACASGSGGGGGATSTKSKLTIGIIQEPTVLDPTVDATASISLLLRDNVYEGLVRLDPNLKIV